MDLSAQTRMCKYNINVSHHKSMKRMNNFSFASTFLHSLCIRRSVDSLQAELDGCIVWNNSTRLEALGYLYDCLSRRVQSKQVVKVIRHKAHRRRRRMVQCYSTGAGNVSSHYGTLVPPGEYDSTCASLGPLVSITETANGSVQPFLRNRS